MLVRVHSQQCPGLPLIGFHPQRTTELFGVDDRAIDYETSVDLAVINHTSGFAEACVTGIWVGLAGGTAKIVFRLPNQDCPVVVKRHRWRMTAVPYRVGVVGVAGRQVRL